MALVNMKELLANASEGNYAVGSFSVGNMEMVMGAVRAMEELSSPGILQIAQVRLPYSPLEFIGPLMVRAARGARVPVAVHFDHGTTVEAVRQALDLGFTSVMFDGSHLSLEDNIKQTRQVVEMAAACGAAVEGEIGQVGGTEDGKASQGVCSNPEEAVRFRQETGVDALAVAIGNVHGSYRGEPQLQFPVLEDIARRLPDVPLVLHGGSGISDEDFRRCIRLGIRKINIATASLVYSVEAIRAALQKDPAANYFQVSDSFVQGTCRSVKRHIRIFMSENRA